MARLAAERRGAAANDDRNRPFPVCHNLGRSLVFGALRR
jgi:hypothetical protein